MKNKNNVTNKVLSILFLISSVHNQHNLIMKSHAFSFMSFNSMIQRSSRTTAYVHVPTASSTSFRGNTKNTISRIFSRNSSSSISRNMLWPICSSHFSERMNHSSSSYTTRTFGSKRGTLDNPAGSIHSYDQQSKLPNLNMDNLKQTIHHIREIIDYPTYDVTLILNEDEDMKDINLESRDIDKPTDILSFPMHDTAKGGAKGAGTLEEPDFDIPEYYSLGDMIVDVEYVMRRCEEDRIYHENEHEIHDDIDSAQSSSRDVSEDNEEEDLEEYVGDDDRGVSGAMARIYDPEERIRLLLIHGMLHLVGYDHIDDDDYEVMVKKEEEVLIELEKRMKE